MLTIFLYHILQHFVKIANYVNIVFKNVVSCDILTSFKSIYLKIL
jgi:hypothetical protein